MHLGLIRERAEALQRISRSQLLENGLSASVVAKKIIEELSNTSGVIYDDADYIKNSGAPAKSRTWDVVH